ncbi:MAG TPA: hypothetical protein VEY33_05115 [Gemmatimonadota bacterium]|nr:hypothetical protein [Gemmatimonadota bacterium]
MIHGLRDQDLDRGRSRSRFDVSSGHGSRRRRAQPTRQRPQGQGPLVDPARAIVCSVPLPRSHCHELDVVLHDGEPNGYRIRDGRRLPVFDALEILERSNRETFEFQLEAAREEDVEALARLAESNDVTVEDWTATVRPLCRRCSEGVPHDEHDEHEPGPWVPLRQVGISSRARREADETLARWVAAAPGRRVVDNFEGGDR